MVTDANARSAPLFVFAGGGTGGHLYPSLALADALRELLPKARFVFFGTQRPVDERIIAQAECELVTQNLPAMRAAFWRWPGAILGFQQTSRRCRQRFHADRPAIVIGSGGYSSIPAVREAHRLGIRTAMLNPDALPGRANRLLASSVDAIFTQWAETREHLPPTATVHLLGCPVRKAFRAATGSAGVARFGLQPDRKTLLVTGASLGSRSVNQAMVAVLDMLNDRPAWQVLHLTGDHDFETVRAAYRQHRAPATVLPFTHDMADALAAADLVVGRAGASTLAELTAVGRASILLPYPHHRDQHQLANARCLERASAATIISDMVDVAMNAPALGRELARLMDDDNRRESMAAAARTLGRPGAAADVAVRVALLATREESAAPADSLQATFSGTR